MVRYISAKAAMCMNAIPRIRVYGRRDNQGGLRVVRVSSVAWTVDPIRPTPLS